MNTFDWALAVLDGMLRDARRDRRDAVRKAREMDDFISDIESRIDKVREDIKKAEGRS
jgi:hypothetical protein